MYVYELHECGIKEIILQSQHDPSGFAIVELYDDNGDFGADYKDFTKTIKEWGGYFYISSTDAMNNKNRIYID